MQAETISISLFHKTKTSKMARREKMLGFSYKNY